MQDKVPRVKCHLPHKRPPKWESGREASIVDVTQMSSHRCFEATDELSVFVARNNLNIVFDAIGPLSIADLALGWMLAADC